MTTLNNALLARQSLFNFKPSNTRKLRRALDNVTTKTANGIIAIVGDSTSAGDGAGTGTNGFVGARPLTPARRMAALLNSTVNAQEVAFTGDGGIGAVPYASYDPRAVLNSGWAFNGGLTFGGFYFDNSTTTNALAFTPTQSFDTIVYYYAQSSGRGAFTVDVDGGAALDTRDANSSTAMVKRTLTTTLGSHTINFKRTSGGGVDILGVTVYNSAAPVLDIWNLGNSGTTVSSWQSVVNPWAPFNSVPALGADCYIIDLGINDWINSTDPTAFTNSYQALITSYKAVGDVILCNPVPRDITLTTAANQSIYANIIKSLAMSNDLPLIDFRNSFESYEISNPLGIYFNGTHPNALGYNRKGRLMANAVLGLD